MIVKLKLSSDKLQLIEISLITLGLFIVLLLPTEWRENGWVWATFAVSIFAISFPEHVERSNRQRLENCEGGYKRCDCCDELVKETDSLCHHCKLEAIYRVYR